MLSEAEEIAAEYDREIDTDSDNGDPQRLIPEYARENTVDHIVMGVHGRAEEDRSLVGQVAETVFFRCRVARIVMPVSSKRLRKPISRHVGNLFEFSFLFEEVVRAFDDVQFFLT